MRCFLTLAMASATILSCSLVQEAEAYAKYVALLPNGDNISGYPAIGHPDSAGADGVNTFGEAFKAAGNTWTTALCKADSDGDGYTNGEELGDPCCTWTTTNTAGLVTSGVSHPGLKTLVPTNSALKAGCTSSSSTASSASTSTTKATTATTATTSASASTASSGTSTDFTAASGSSTDVVGTVSATESPSAATTDDDTVTSTPSTASSSSSSASATVSTSDAKPLAMSVAASVLAAAVLAFAA